MRGFLRVLHGEWTKFRSVRSTALCLVAAVGVSVLLELLGSSAGKTDANELPRYTDQAYFVHKPLAGNGSVIARVVSQQSSHEWAKAGLLVKAGVAPGTPYAAVLVTPDHGVRMEAMFDTEQAGPADRAPRWLKLTRAGNSITGYSSADGQAWQEVGTMTVALPRDVEVGLFVASPPRYVSTRTGSGSAISIQNTVGSAVFDSVAWQGRNRGGTGPARTSRRFRRSRPAGFRPATCAGPATPSRSPDRATSPATASAAGIRRGRTTWSAQPVRRPVGMIAVIALGVLLMTAEYRTGMIRTTFAAGPRRGHVLAAKAVVLGGTVFVAGLVASVASFLLAQPGMHAAATTRLRIRMCRCSTAQSAGGHRYGDLPGPDRDVQSRHRGAQAAHGRRDRVRDRARRGAADRRTGDLAGGRCLGKPADADRGSGRPADRRRGPGDRPVDRPGCAVRVRRRRARPGVLAARSPGRVMRAGGFARRVDEAAHGPEHGLDADRGRRS